MFNGSVLVAPYSIATTTGRVSLVLSSMNFLKTRAKSSCHPAFRSYAFDSVCTWREYSDDTFSVSPVSLAAPHPHQCQSPSTSSYWEQIPRTQIIADSAGSHSFCREFAQRDQLYDPHTDVPVPLDRINIQDFMHWALRPYSDPEMWPSPLNPICAHIWSGYGPPQAQVQYGNRRKWVPSISQNQADVRTVKPQRKQRFN